MKQNFIKNCAHLGILSIVIKTWNASNKESLQDKYHENGTVHACIHKWFSQLFYGSGLATALETQDEKHLVDGTNLIE